MRAFNARKGYKKDNRFNFLVTDGKLNRRGEIAYSHSKANLIALKLFLDDMIKDLREDEEREPTILIVPKELYKDVKGFDLGVADLKIEFFGSKHKQLMEDENITKKDFYLN